MEDFPKFLFRTPYVLYGKRVVHFEKWTGGGKSTLTRILVRREGAQSREAQLASRYGYPGSTPEQSCLT